MFAGGELMPMWLLRFMPHIGIAIAILGVVWWLDHAGYQRAMADRDARDAKILDQVRSDLRQSEQRLAIAIDGIAGTYDAQRAALARAGATLQPIILKEAANDPRLSDPAAGLTPGLLDAINRARSTSTCSAAAAGRIDCAVPDAAAAPGDGHR
jgi:hypothetical protein